MIAGNDSSDLLWMDEQCTPHARLISTLTFHNSVLTFEFISWLRVIAVISGRDTAVTVWHSPRNERWLPWGSFVL